MGRLFKNQQGISIFEISIIILILLFIAFSSIVIAKKISNNNEKNYNETPLLEQQ